MYQGKFWSGVYFICATISIYALACASGGPSHLDSQLSRVDQFVRARRPASASMIHSHNDYEQAQPLLIALENGLDSVEADVWYDGGQLKVSHLGWNFKGTLEELYLKPLQRLVDHRGSVYGDEQTFYLWIDLKHSHSGLSYALAAALERYPMVSRQVQVVLTGSNLAKKDFVRRFPQLGVMRDSNVFRADDPTNDLSWSWYSLKWSDYFSWNGQGLMPPREKEKLRRLVRSIHAKRRKVRFWSTPDTQAFWQAAHSEQVDSIGTDSPSKISEFMRALWTRQDVSG